MAVSRRRFVQGTGALTLPGFLVGCGHRQAQRAAIAPATTATPANPFATWFGIDEQRIAAVMAVLTERGADHAELYFQHKVDNWITMEDAIVSSAYTSVELGVGLRVVIGEQVGYAYSENLTQEAMVSAARSAAAIAQGRPASLPAAFTPSERGRYYEIDASWSDIGVDQKLPLVRAVESAARARDAAVTKVTVYFHDSDERIAIATLSGQLVTDRRPMTRLSVSVTAEKDGKVQSNSANVAGRRGLELYREENLQQLARDAVDRTMILFEARQPPAGEMPVVLLAGASGILLHEAIGHGMEADYNRKKTSTYATMLGQKVAPDFVTIVDDGTLEHESGAINCDDEGTPSSRTVLVENGVLTSYLHDQISAAHYGMKQSTGSGRRESFRHAPLPRMRCTYMLNGPHTREEIIASVGRGIVAETFTNGQVEIGAGDFTFYVKNGWMVEDGKLTAPIRDANIIGNGPDVLRKIAMAGDDSRLDRGGWMCGKDGQGVPVSQGLPTVLVSSMTVGGRNA